MKEGLRESFRRLLAHDFAALLVAHGEPMPTGGKAALTQSRRAADGLPAGRSRGTSTRREARAADRADSRPAAVLPYPGR